MIVPDNSDHWLELAGRKYCGPGMGRLVDFEWRGKVGLGAVAAQTVPARPTSPLRTTSIAAIASGAASSPSASPSGASSSAAPSASPAPANAAQLYSQDATNAVKQYCSGGAAACGCTVDSASIDTLFQNSAASRFLMWPPPDNNFVTNGCSGASSTDTAENVGAGISGAGATLAKITTVAPNPITGIAAAVTEIAGMITSLFGAGHAAAVTAQNNALCSAVPAFNQVLQSIDADLAAGTITPSQAEQQYSTLMSQFTAALQKGTSYKKCDGLYAYNMAAQMVIAARNADLQNGLLTGGAQGPWASSSGGAGTVTIAGVTFSTTDLLVGGGAILLLFFFLRD